jgi:ABC-type branched-subunit amino acid transport system substrate-binding protein
MRTPDMSERPRPHRAGRLLLAGAALFGTAFAGTAVGLSDATAAAASVHVVNALSVSCPAPVTATCVTVGNVSTTGGVIPGLFEGTVVGADAYLSYLNSTQGGVNGRKISLLTADDQLNGDNNRIDTQELLPKVFAFVGSYSLDDQNGATILAQNPTVPNVSEGLSLYATDLPNTFSISPVHNGWGEGGFLYFKKHDPQATQHVGILIAQESSAQQQAVGLIGAMQHVGFHIAYQSEIGPLDSQFTTQVLAMQHAGVQFVDLTVMDVQDAEKIVEEMNQQGFHPAVIESAGPIYTDGFVSAVGGASVADGIYLDQSYPLYLGKDASTIPADKTFLTWVNKVQPGFQPDLFTLFGWAEAQLFAQSLASTGAHPTQAALLAALRSTTSFNAGGLIPPADLKTKSSESCWILAQVVHGTFTRVSPSPKTGLICHAPYYSGTG